MPALNTLKTIADVKNILKCQLSSQHIYWFLPQYFLKDKIQLNIMRRVSAYKKLFKRRFKDLLVCEKGFF